MELTPGSGQVSVSVRKSLGGIVVTSMLEFQGLEEQDTGGIQCVGYHVAGGMKMTVNKANLIVVCKCGECGVGWEIVECGGEKVCGAEVWGVV